jgi:peroxiredoxin Q/BCP
MRQTLRVVAPMLAVFGLLAAEAVAQQLIPGQPELRVGDEAPDFTLQASDGQTYTLSKLRGKTVVLAWFPKAFTGG